MESEDSPPGGPLPDGAGHQGGGMWGAAQWLGHGRIFYAALWRAFSDFNSP